MESFLRTFAQVGQVALPILGGVVGSLVAPGVGTVIGPVIGQLAAGALGQAAQADAARPKPNARPTQRRPAAKPSDSGRPTRPRVSAQRVDWVEGRKRAELAYGMPRKTATPLGVRPRTLPAVVSTVSGLAAGRAGARTVESSSWRRCMDGSDGCQYMPVG